MVWQCRNSAQGRRFFLGNVLDDVKVKATGKLAISKTVDVVQLGVIKANCYSYTVFLPPLQPTNCLTGAHPQARCSRECGELGGGRRLPYPLRSAKVSSSSSSSKVCLVVFGFSNAQYSIKLATNFMSSQVGYFSFLPIGHGNISSSHSHLRMVHSPRTVSHQPIESATASLSRNDLGIGH